MSKWKQITNDKPAAFELRLRHALEECHPILVYKNFRDQHCVGLRNVNSAGAFDRRQPANFLNSFSAWLMEMLADCLQQRRRYCYITAQMKTYRNGRIRWHVLAYFTNHPLNSGSNGVRHELSYIDVKTHAIPRISTSRCP